MATKQHDTSRIEKAHLLYYVVLLLVVIVIIRILVIQYRDGEALRAKSAQRAIIESLIKADRGNIYSRDGDLIATSLPIFDIFVDFSEKNVEEKHFQKHHDSLAICLARHFPAKSYDEYKKILLDYRHKQSTYGFLLRNIDYNQLKLVRSFPLFNLGRYVGGIIEVKKEKRVHPFGWLAQRTIGFSRTDFRVGIEGAYDSQLSGKDGIRLKQRLPNNRFVPLDDNFIVEPVQGVDIITTLDMHVQDVAESALHEHLVKHNARWGCAVLMEVETGEIRAIANLEKDQDGNYIEKYNHALGTRYEPGSSFKLFSMLIMLEQQKLDLDSMVNTGYGKIRVGKSDVSDTYPLGIISIREVFEKSSNVGTVMLVKKFYKDNPSKYIDKLYDMKMHLPMGIDILGEQPSIIPRPGTSGWYKASSLETISYGYGVSITPLQLLAYYNAVANNGKLMRPLFVREFQVSGQTVKKFEPVVLHHRICSKKTAETLKDLMIGVVEKGTATNLKQTACKIAGKTATARIWDNENKQYSERHYNASFVGYFPAENPRYSCIVVVNKPSMGLYYGGNVSAPVFRDIAEIVYATEQEIHDPAEKQKFSGIDFFPKIGKTNRNTIRSFLNLMPKEISSVMYPDSPWITLTNDSIPEFVAVEFADSIMPDVTGMSLRDASVLLESMGCTVRATGKGKVIKQSVASGLKIKSGQIVYLTLNIQS
jgi:cell division protein FtsI (penicillin-binding protein 3)